MIIIIFILYQKLEPYSNLLRSFFQKGSFPERRFPISSTATIPGSLSFRFPISMEGTSGIYEEREPLQTNSWSVPSAPAKSRAKRAKGCRIESKLSLCKFVRSSSKWHTLRGPSSTCPRETGSVYFQWRARANHANSRQFSMHRRAIRNEAFAEWTLRPLTRSLVRLGRGIGRKCG